MNLAKHGPIQIHAHRAKTFWKMKAVEGDDQSTWIKLSCVLTTRPLIAGRTEPHHGEPL